MLIFSNDEDYEGHGPENRSEKIEEAKKLAREFQAYLNYQFPATQGHRLIYHKLQQIVKLVK